MRIEFSAFCGRLMAESRSLLQHKIENRQVWHMCFTVRFPFARTSWISCFCFAARPKFNCWIANILNLPCWTQLADAISNLSYRKEIFIDSAAIPRRIKMLTSVYLIFSSNACAMWRNNVIKLEHKKRRRVVTNRRPCWENSRPHCVVCLFSSLSGSSAASI